MEKQKNEIKQVLGSMQKNLECAICLDLLKHPVSTKCNHQFCRFCITSFLESQKPAPCPLCKEIVTKRSLCDRDDISEIVANVQKLIIAFQDDTGEVYTPPSGPQREPVSSTPENSQSNKPLGANRQKKEEPKKKNVRQGKKRKSDVLVEDVATASDSSSTIELDTHVLETRIEDQRQRKEADITVQQGANIEKSQLAKVGLKSDMPRKVQVRSRMRNESPSHKTRSHTRVDDGITRSRSSDLVKYLTSAACGAELEAEHFVEEEESEDAHEAFGSMHSSHDDPLNASGSLTTSEKRKEPAWCSDKALKNVKTYSRRNKNSDYINEEKQDDNSKVQHWLGQVPPPEELSLSNKSSRETSTCSNVHTSQGLSSKKKGCTELPECTENVEIDSFENPNLGCSASDLKKTKSTSAGQQEILSTNKENILQNSPKRKSLNYVNHNNTGCTEKQQNLQLETGKASPAPLNTHKNEKKIFKSVTKKTLHMKQVKGKVIIEKSNGTCSVKRKELDQDIVRNGTTLNIENDPYEFKSSQKTPVAKPFKKTRLTRSSSKFPKLQFDKDAEQEVIDLTCSEWENDVSEEKKSKNLSKRNHSKHTVKQQKATEVKAKQSDLNGIDLRDQSTHQDLNEIETARQKLQEADDCVLILSTQEAENGFKSSEFDHCVLQEGVQDNAPDDSCEDLAENESLENEQLLSESTKNNKMKTVVDNVLDIHVPKARGVKIHDKKSTMDSCFVVPETPKVLLNDCIGKQGEPKNKTPVECSSSVDFISPTPTVKKLLIAVSSATTSDKQKESTSDCFVDLGSPCLSPEEEGCRQNTDNFSEVKNSFSHHGSANATSNTQGYKSFDGVTKKHNVGGNQANSRNFNFTKSDDTVKNVERNTVHLSGKQEYTKENLELEKECQDMNSRQSVLVTKPMADELPCVGETEQRTLPSVSGGPESLESESDIVPPSAKEESDTSSGKKTLGLDRLFNQGKYSRKTRSSKLQGQQVSLEENDRKRPKATRPINKYSHESHIHSSISDDVVVSLVDISNAVPGENCMANKTNAIAKDSCMSKQSEHFSEGHKDSDETTLGSQFHLNNIVNNKLCNTETSKNIDTIGTSLENLEGVEESSLTQPPSINAEAVILSNDIVNSVHLSSKLNAEIVDLTSCPGRSCKDFSLSLTECNSEKSQLLLSKVHPGKKAELKINIEVDTYKNDDENEVIIFSPEQQLVEEKGKNKEVDDAQHKREEVNQSGVLVSTIPETLESEKSKTSQDPMNLIYQDMNRNQGKKEKLMVTPLNNPNSPDLDLDVTCVSMSDEILTTAASSSVDVASTQRSMGSTGTVVPATLGASQDVSPIIKGLDLKTQHKEDVVILIEEDECIVPKPFAETGQKISANSTEDEGTPVLIPPTADDSSFCDSGKRKSGSDKHSFLTCTNTLASEVQSDKEDVEDIIIKTKKVDMGNTKKASMEDDHSGVIDLCDDHVVEANPLTKPETKQQKSRSSDSHQDSVEDIFDHQYLDSSANEKHENEESLVERSLTHTRTSVHDEDEACSVDVTQLGPDDSMPEQQKILNESISLIETNHLNHQDSITQCSEHAEQNRIGNLDTENSKEQEKETLYNSSKNFNDPGKCEKNLNDSNYETINKLVNKENDHSETFVESESRKINHPGMDTPSVGEESDMLLKDYEHGSLSKKTKEFSGEKSPNPSIVLANSLYSGSSSSSKKTKRGLARRLKLSDTSHTAVVQTDVLFTGNNGSSSCSDLTDKCDRESISQNSNVGNTSDNGNDNCQDQLEKYINLHATKNTLKHTGDQSNDENEGSCKKINDISNDDNIEHLNSNKIKNPPQLPEQLDTYHQLEISSQVDMAEVLNDTSSLEIGTCLRTKRRIKVTPKTLSKKIFMMRHPSDLENSDLDDMDETNTNLSASASCNVSSDAQNMCLDGNTENQRYKLNMDSSSEDTEDSNPIIKKKVIGRKKFTPVPVVDDSDDEDSDELPIVDIDGNRKSPLSRDSSDELNASTQSSTSSHKLNITSSSALSSQSDSMITQNPEALERDVARMKKEIAALEEMLQKQKEQETASKEKTIDEDELSDDSDFVLKDEEDEENFGLEPNILNPHDEDLPSSAKSKGSETQAPFLSEDSNDLFTSPLSPSPPPPVCQPHSTPVQVPAEVKKTTDFLKQFRTPKGDDKKEANNDSPSSSQGSVKTDITTSCDSPRKSFKIQENINALQLQGNKFTKESNSPSVLKEKTSNRMKNVKQLQKGKKSVVVVPSGLTLDQMKEVQKITQINGCQFQVKFDSSVTHLVVKTVPPGSCVCERTLKVFQALSKKCWIVDYKWISNSKSAGHLLPEAEFEVVGDTVTENCHFGPKRARLSEVSLLKNIYICPAGDSDGFTQANLKELVEACGGTIMGHVSEIIPKGQGHAALVIRCEDFDDEENIPPADVIKEINSVYRQYGIVTVSREWFLDSLTVFHLQPLKEYVLTSLDKITLPQICLEAGK